MNELTQDYVRSLFDYQDGELYWKMSGSGRKIDVPAGAINGHGYRQITINYKSHPTHRLIFLYHHGYVPEFLDHIDGNRLNNSISNLRVTTNRENQMNCKKNRFMNGKPTTSKYKGVYRNKHSKKWRGQIYIDGKTKHLGLFDSEIGAAKAYNRAAIKAFGEFAKLNIIDY